MENEQQYNKIAHHYILEVREKIENADHLSGIYCRALGPLSRSSLVVNLSWFLTGRTYLVHVKSWPGVDTKIKKVLCFFVLSISAAHRVQKLHDAYLVLKQ